MADPLFRLGRFLRELKRRKVYRVAAGYLVAAFVVLQLAGLAGDAFGFPGWFEPMVWVLAGLGLPIALVLAWAFEVTPEGVRRTPEAVRTEEGDSEVGRRLSTGYKVLVGLGLLAAAAAGGWSRTGGGGASTPEPVVPGVTELDSTRVAVFPFAVRGGEKLDHWGEGMVELMGRSLSGAGSLKAVDPNTLLSRIDEPADELERDSVRRIAARFGAGRYVQGSVYRLGDSLRLSATWYRTEGGEIGSAVVSGAGEGEIQSMVDELARAAIADLVKGEVGRRRRLAAQTTSSVEALKAYLRGQEALRRFDFESATRRFSEAVEKDSTFALAHYRLSLAAGWSGRDLRLAHRAARHAVKWSANLPGRDRRLLRAYAAYRSGRADQAERLYRSLRQRYPGDALVAYQLGETLFHFNPLRGRPITEARDPFRTAMRLDPTFHVPLLHRVHLAIVSRDTARLDSLTSNLDAQQLAPLYENVLRATRAYLLAAGPDSTLLRRLRQADPLVHISAYLAAFLWEGSHPDETSHLIEPEVTAQWPDEARAALQRSRADVLAGVGRLEAARKATEAMASLDSASYWIARGQLATLPFVSASESFASAREDLRIGLSNWDARRMSRRLLSTLYLLPRQVYPSGRLYLLGLLWATKGDREGALRAAAELDSMQATALAPSGPADFARSIRAEVARRGGRRTAALGHLRKLKHHVDPVFASQRLHSAARERFLRARLLEQEGRPRAALAWYRTFTGLSWGELPYLAPAQFGRGRTLAELGQREAAIHAYRRGLDLWAEADSILQPTVEKARHALASLTRDSTAVSALSAAGAGRQ